VIFIHDLRLNHRNNSIQIDHLLISTKLQTVWIFETKNLSGSISINEHGEWRQTLGYTEEIISSPIDQAEGAASVFRKWLKSNGHSTYHKVIPVVVFHHSVNLDRQNLPENSKITKSDMLSSWFDEHIDDMSMTEFFGAVKNILFKKKEKRKVLRLLRELTKADKFSRSSLPKKPSHNKSQSPSFVTTGEEIVSGIYTKNTIYGVAIKPTPGHPLIEKLDQLCAGLGIWNDNFQNWIIEPSNMPELERRLRSIAS
jgi:hypothetical protein